MTSNSLVRSNLEYASCIWSPYKHINIEVVERVLRRASKQFPDTKDLHYPERLNNLKLPTLVYRRARRDIIETYKLLHDKYHGEYMRGLDAKRINNQNEKIELT